MTLVSWQGTPDPRDALANAGRPRRGLDALFGSGQPQSTPEVDEAMRLAGNKLTTLLGQNPQAPSLMDVGRASLRAYGSLSTNNPIMPSQSLEQMFQQRQQYDVNQANAAISLADIRMKQAEMMADRDPRAKMMVDILSGLPPDHAARVWAAAEADPDEPTPENLSRWIEDTKQEDAEAPTTHGAMQFNDATGQWEEIPGYVDLESKLKAAGATKIEMPDMEGSIPPGHTVTRDENGRITRIDPIPGGPLGDVTKAAAVASLKISRRNLAKARKELINSDGTVNRGILFAGQAGFPMSRGKSVYNQLETIAIAKTHAESGAGTSEQEVTRKSRVYLPSVTEEDEEIIRKVDGLLEWSDETLNIVQPGWDKETATPTINIDEINPEDIDSMTPEQLDDLEKRLQ